MNPGEETRWGFLFFRFDVDLSAQTLRYNKLERSVMSRMKITIKLPKPRNPLVAAAKTRRAGAHQSDKHARQLRRTEKHKLHLLLSGRKLEGLGDE